MVQLHNTSRLVVFHIRATVLCKQNAQEDVEVMLIGNKTDVDQARKISKNEGQTFADLKGIPFCEVSAKSSENINLVGYQ